MSKLCDASSAYTCTGRFCAPADTISYDDGSVVCADGAHCERPCVLVCERGKEEEEEGERGGFSAARSHTLQARFAGGLRSPVPMTTLGAPVIRNK